MTCGKIILDSITAHVLYVLGEPSKWIIRYFRLSRLNGKSKESFLKSKSECQGSDNKQFTGMMSQKKSKKAFS